MNEGDIQGGGTATLDPPETDESKGPEGPNTSGRWRDQPGASPMEMTEHEAPDEEPVFTLRGRDLLAPEIVDEWALLAERRGVNREKVIDARQIARKMRKWQEEHGGRLPD